MAEASAARRRGRSLVALMIHRSTIGALRASQPAFAISLLDSVVAGRQNLVRIVTALGVVQ
jgi:hypothetical protein